MGIFGNCAEMSWNQSICSRVVTHASLSAKPESAEATPTRAIFGPSSPDSFAYFDPDSSCWKTSQATFLLDLEQYSETWPDSGTMRNGCVYERQISALRTCESGSLLWPTATQDVTDRTERYAQGGMPLSMLAGRWPTARSEDSESCGNHPGASDSLTGVSRNWTTPKAKTGGANSKRAERGAGGTDLQEQSENWLTPHGMYGTDHTGKTGRGGEFAKQANQWQTPATDSFRSRGGDQKDEMGLDQQARFFPTPAQRDYRTPNRESYQERSGTKKGEQLQNFVAHSLPDPVIPDGRESSPVDPTLRRRLNPRFVEWLMGFPIGWTER